MAKKIDYASMFTLRSDGRYQGYWHELVRGEPKGKRHTICDRDPEKLYRRIQEKETAAETVLTFGAIAEAWHDKHWEEIREGTKACYDAPYKRALEQFGDRAADEIQVSDIRAHLEQMKSGGYSAKSIKTQRTIYKLIFQYAINDSETGRFIRYNPAEGAALPSGLKKPVRRDAPSDSVVDVIRKNARTDPWGMFALFLLSTGFRRGEALAVQWKDVDFKRKTITCSKTLIYRHGTASIGETKTEAGVRSVPILPDLEAPLTEYKPKGAKASDYVFPGTDPTKPMPEITYQRRWSRYIERMGIDLTAHVLRHGYATMLYDAGVDPYTAQKLLGHANIETILAIYTHLKQARETASLSKLSEYVSASMEASR